jgi:hypothetical protein
MTVYTWLVVLLVAAALIFKGNRRRNTIFIVIAFVLLFAVMGLRDVYAFGSDASGSNGSYPIIYRGWGNTEWGDIFHKGESNYNIGFSYLLKLIFVLTDGDYQWLITIISLFVMLSYMRFIRKYSPSPIQSILLFLGLLYYTFLFDALKQALAMSILLFAFDAIIDKKPIKFIIITLIASAFHFPALVFLPAYWIGRMKIGRGYIVILAVLLIITYYFRDWLLRLMLDTYGEGESTASMEGVRFLRNKVIIMIAFAVFAAIIRPPAIGDTLYNALLMFVGVSIIFQTFCGYNNTFERLADYYFHTSIILVPLIFERGGKFRSRLDLEKNDQILRYATLIICVIAVWRFLSFVNGSALFNPYRFFWER